jgi:Tfp pilus assembly protein PilN
MINLLPIEEKRRNLTEKKKRIIIILSCLILFFSFCLIFVLFLISSYFSNKVIAQKADVERSKALFERSELKNLQEKIDAFNSILKQLDAFYRSQTNFSDIIEEVARTLPQGIYFTNFSASLKTPDKGSPYIAVAFSGFSANREDLFNFKKNLEQTGKFSEIDFPASNWIKPTDSDFSVSFKIYK